MPSQNQHADHDHPTYGDVISDISEREAEYLRKEDPCRFLATDLDEEARIKGIESQFAITVWKRAEYALAQYLDLHPRDDDRPDKSQPNIIGMLEDRADELRREQDTEAAVEAVQQAESESEVQDIIMDEVSRESPRKPVVAACNKRQDQLRAAATADGGEVDE